MSSQNTAIPRQVEGSKKNIKNDTRIKTEDAGREQEKDGR